MCINCTKLIYRFTSVVLKNSFCYMDAPIDYVIVIFNYYKIHKYVQYVIIENIYVFLIKIGILQGNPDPKDSNFDQEDEGKYFFRKLFFFEICV